uniref:C-type lectin domain-containing protein n=1 Tax=Heliothis virescens TaxID=7102 RepID=A0A2A4J179_HELVI
MCSFLLFVPFGEINAVSSWLGITGPVNKPPAEIKARPVLGFQCTRSEVSGKRFWGVIKNLCGTPENFFKTSFVYNYLPQQWMTKSGCNLTPGDFKIFYLPHPSPRVLHNNNWEETATKCLQEHNLLQYYQHASH